MSFYMVMLNKALTAQGMGKGMKKINITTSGLRNFNAIQKAQGYTKNKHIRHPGDWGWVGQGKKNKGKEKRNLQCEKSGFVQYVLTQRACVEL